MSGGSLRGLRRELLIMARERFLSLLIERLHGELPASGIGESVFQDLIGKLGHGDLSMPGLVVKDADQESLDGGRIMLGSGHGDLLCEKLERQSMLPIGNTGLNKISPVQMFIARKRGPLRPGADNRGQCHPGVWPNRSAGLDFVSG